jgi:proliferating cell nuclear antigen
MFKATLSQSVTFRKLIDALKDLVSQVNIEASSNGLSLQALDSAHVSLVCLMLNEEGFEEYRCDKNMTLGLDLVEFSKILKMASSDDIMELHASEENSFLTISLFNKSILTIYSFRNRKIS